MNKETVLALVVLIQFFYVPSLIQYNNISPNISSSQYVKILQEDEPIVQLAPTIEFISPNDGDEIEFGIVPISYRFTNSSSIQRIFILIDGDIRTIYDITSPYNWHPERDGMFVLNLICADNQGKTGSTTISVRIFERIDVPSFSVLLAILGLVGTIAIGYKFINQPRTFKKSQEDLECVDMIKIPLSYVIKSKVKTIRK